MYRSVVLQGLVVAAIGVVGCGDAECQEPLSLIGDACVLSTPELCTEGQVQPCGSSTGACVPGTQTCQSDNRWSDCVGAVGPSAELCDGVDNDCDGVADNGPPEVCDGVDNDCNGQVDDGVLLTTGLIANTGATAVAVVHDGFLLSHAPYGSVHADRYGFDGVATGTSWQDDGFAWLTSAASDAQGTRTIALVSDQHALHVKRLDSSGLYPVLVDSAPITAAFIQDTSVNRFPKVVHYAGGGALVVGLSDRHNIAMVELNESLGTSSTKALSTDLSSAVDFDLAPSADGDPWLLYATSSTRFHLGRVNYDQGAVLNAATFDGSPGAIAQSQPGHVGLAYRDPGGVLRFSVLDSETLQCAAGDLACDESLGAVDPHISLAYRQGLWAVASVASGQVKVDVLSDTGTRVFSVDFPVDQHLNLGVDVVASGLTFAVTEQASGGGYVGSETMFIGCW